VKIDLNNLPGKPSPIGDPHWLSGSGKVDRVGNYERAKAAYLAKRGPPPHTPARPETMAKLEAAAEHAKKTEQMKIVKVWNTAIGHLDRTEPRLRDLIERELLDVAGLAHSHIGDAMQATKALMDKITPIRLKAIKKAFRYVRDKIGVRIMGRTVAEWAAAIAKGDIHRTETAIRTGLLSGLDNTEIARQVVGSQRLAGVDGVTEITRRHIAHLARVTLKRRKRA
jgi:hypothetical protein